MAPRDVHYCHVCSEARGYLQGVATASLLDDPYQLGKYLKHTVPDPTYNVQSVFASPSTQAYENYIVSSSLSGSVQIDRKGRRNLIWVAGTPTGFQQKNGVLQHPQDAVKVVLYTDTRKIHAFPQSSTQFTADACPDCGKTSVY